MEIRHFIVPAACYPRYRYTREHVKPLLKHFQLLLQDCNINTLFEIPPLDDVDIYVISDNNSEILTIEDVTSKNTANVETEITKCKDVDEFRNKCPDRLTSIHVASYKRVHQNGKEGENIFAFFGKCNVLIIEEDEVVEVSNPEYKNVDNSITCVKPRNNFPNEIGLLLERIVLKELNKRVLVLTVLKNVDPAAAVFAILDQDIDRLMKKKYDKSKSITKRPVSASKRDLVHLHEEWCKARLEAVENQIISEYRKYAPGVCDQLLHIDNDRDRIGRDIPALKICEQINPHLQSDLIPIGATHIPESLIEQIETLKRSQEITVTAVFLENRYRKHLEQVHQHKDRIIQLHGECMAMFYRSRVPEFERPQRSQSTYPTLDENTAKSFLGIDGVTGCGYRFHTLDICIKDILTDDERQLCEQRIKEMAEINKISEYKIYQEQENVTQFSDYGVGSTLTSTLERRASLGGFALKGQGRDLSVLVARHFADDGKPLYALDSDGNKSVIAYVLKPTKPTQELHRYASLDIAVATVIKRIRPNCRTMFKDACGSPLESKLTQFEATDFKWLMGMPVHIWGAASSPGLGKIIIPDFYVEGMKRLVKIEDRYPVDSELVPFSKVGDSGAIVCADDPDGEIVHVISMLMGSSNFVAKENDPSIKGQYLSIRLKDGVLQLEREQGDTFRLC